MTAHAEALGSEKQAGECLTCGSNGNRARLQDIMVFLSRASNYKIDNVQILQKHADIAVSLESICEYVLKNCFPAGNDVFEETIKWKAYCEAEQGLTRIIILPKFNQLKSQNSIGTS